MRVPLGVIAIIYESRPNVTIDAAALCIKSGNAAVLRGGSEASIQPPSGRLVRRRAARAGAAAFGRAADRHDDRAAVGLWSRCPSMSTWSCRAGAAD